MSFKFFKHTSNPNVLYHFEISWVWDVREGGGGGGGGVGGLYKFFKAPVTRYRITIGATSI